MIATPSAWTALSIIFYASSADRPEIKEDVDEVITSMLNISLANTLTTWYTCDKDFDHATHATGFEHLLKDTMYEPTFHGLIVHESNTTLKPENVYEGKRPHCHFKHLTIKAKSMKDFAESPTFISHTKFLVPHDEILLEEFETLNQNMVEETAPRCWDGHLFVGGYVLKDTLATGWYHVYNKYHADFSGCPPDETPAYQAWKGGRKNWLALPNHINQRSDQMMSPNEPVNSTIKGKVPAGMVGRWVTCNGDPESFEASEFDKIVEWPMDTFASTQDTDDDASYFFFQLYTPDKSGALNEYPKANGKTVHGHDIQCRYQNLHFLKDSQKADIETTDSNDIILHTEYEIDTDHVEAFLTLTKNMLVHNKQFHKQTYLFTTSEYNGYGFVHFIQVFDKPEHLKQHSDSQALKEWRAARIEAHGEYVKLADGFSKNLRLNIMQE